MKQYKALFASFTIIAAVVISYLLVQQSTNQRSSTESSSIQKDDDSSSRSCSKPEKIIEGCKKGETVETVSEEGGFKAKFTCLGVIDNKVVDYKHFKLKNGNVLLYSESTPLKRAKVFDAKTNKFIDVSEDIKTTDYPVYTKKELPDNLNLFTPRLLFDSNSNKYKAISKLDNLKYSKFKATRKPNLYETTLIKQLKENKFLYAAKSSKTMNPSAYDVVWLEEPLKRKRYEHGKLNILRNKFPAVLLDDGTILIIGGHIDSRNFSPVKGPHLPDGGFDYSKNNTNSIELYYPNSGKVKIIPPLTSISYNVNGAILIKYIVYISISPSSKDYLYYWKKNTNEMGHVIKSEDSIDNPKTISKLTSNVIYISGYKGKAGIFNIKKFSLDEISTLFKRLRPQITPLGNGKLLISNGVTKYWGSNCFNTAELFEYEDLK